MVYLWKQLFKEKKKKKENCSSAKNNLREQGQIYLSIKREETNKKKVLHSKFAYLGQE